MNKFLIKDVIVVEGKNDACHISSFFECEIVITNGYNVSDDLVLYLKSLDKRIIILTDSDEAGEIIRNKLMKKLDNYENVAVDIACCNRHGKHGVAECEKDEIIRVLTPYITKDATFTGKLNANTLYELGLQGEGSELLRNYLCEKLSFPKSNFKQFLKRVNYSNISEEKIIDLIKEYRAHGN